MNEIMPVITETLVTIGIALLALLAAYATRGINTVIAKLRAETAKLEDDQFRSYADEALLRAEDLVAKTVTQIEQTTAKALRELVKSGAASRKELEDLGKRAVREVMESLTPEYKDAIFATVGDVEAYVTKAVETKVYELKNGLTILPGAIEAVA